MEEISKIFGDKRGDYGWTSQECARRAGYVNVNKGANRLMAIERGRDPLPDEKIWDASPTCWRCHARPLDAVEYFAAAYDRRVFNLSLSDRNQPYEGGHLRGLDLLSHTPNHGVNLDNGVA